ncbi:hypothetical protein K9N68_00800 [Kovacikia minuta CCNUW1]|uniref:hypothetical protein n=1 Tax=Kovacikia minuta TaxID=2931930 RepID=UPI001CCD0423|nr:hypothetical protein [Kovacikia minuta]UBF26584.1 hypothetical protein K9N68_00800 [Kovacikia minuta CCNUW1]
MSNVHGNHSANQTGGKHLLPSSSQVSQLGEVAQLISQLEFARIVTILTLNHLGTRSQEPESKVSSDS